MVTYITIAVIAYLIGSVNFSVIFSKKFAGFDVRTKGSGNAGTTNMLRSVGKKGAALTLICDILKGIVAVLIAHLLSKIDKTADGALLVQLAALFVIIGHTFPIFYKFKGGKGVATTIGVLFILNYQIAAICLVFGLLVIALTRKVSMAAIVTAVLFPVLTVFLPAMFWPNGSYLVFSILLAIIILFNHRENAKRILKGTESKIGEKVE